LGVVVDTSPAAIFITNGSGHILEANASAHQLLESRPGTLTGAPITEFLPALATVPPASSGNRALRSNLECRGRRRDGAYFLAQVWLSTYQGAQGPRMAAIVLDASENLRDREGGGMQSLMMTSRILMGAVSHSVRNLCAAARVAYTNLERETTVAEADDFQALGTLIGGLESIAAMELRRTVDPTSTVDPNTLLDELRIVIEPGLKDCGIHLDWHVAERLPLVLGEHYGLLHALLNVTQNAHRVLTECPEPRTLGVVTAVRADRLELRISDNGGGVAAPEKLFEPFQTGGGGTGLGLYVARALLRSFEGELRYDPIAGGSTFIMEMAIAADVEMHAAGNTD
jgi:signal transduction histidine kinase